MNVSGGTAVMKDREGYRSISKRWIQGWGQGMALAFFGNGFASITWSLVSSLAPMRLIGLTGGVFNFAGGLGGITVPLVVGYLAQGYGFAPALVYISAVALIGALSYILLVGDVKRVG